MEKKMYAVYHHFSIKNSDDEFYFENIDELVALFESKEEAEKFKKDFEKPRKNVEYNHRSYYSCGNLEVKEITIDDGVIEYCWWQDCVNE